MTVVALGCALYVQNGRHVTQLNDMRQKLENDKVNIVELSALFACSGILADLLSDNPKWKGKSKQQIESLAAEYVVEVWGRRTLVKEYSDDVIGGGFEYDDDTIIQELKQFLSLLSADAIEHTSSIIENRILNNNQSDEKTREKFRALMELLNDASAPNGSIAG